MSLPNNQKQPVLLRLRSSKWYIIAVVSLATFTDVFLNASIVPVVPFSLTNRAGVAPNDVQHWTAVLLAVNGAALVAMSPIAGWVADRTGSRRTPMLISLVALLGASVMLCLGRSVGVYIVGRILLGISGAVVWTVGLALVVDTVTKREVGKCLGYVFMSINMAVLIAPLVGGVVYAVAGYYPVFYMSFGLIIVDIILRLCLIEKKTAQKWLSEEAEDDNQSDAAVETQTTSIIPVPDKEDTLFIAVGNLSTTQATGVADCSSAPLPPPSQNHALRFPMLSLLRSPRVLTALFGCLVQSTLFSTFDAVLPLHVHSLFGWTSLGSGLIFLALLIPSFASPVVGWCNDRLGPKWISCMGFVFCFVPLVLLREVTHTGMSQIVLLCALLAIIGFGVNWIAIPLSAEISYAIDAKGKEQPGIYGTRGAYAQGYALLNTGFAAGSLIGPVWSSYVVIKSGWGTLGWSLGLLCAVATVPVIVWTGGEEAIWRRPGHNKEEKNAPDQMV